MGGQKMLPDEESQKIQQPLSPNAKRRRNDALKTATSRTRSEQLRLSKQTDNTPTATARSHMQSKLKSAVAKRPEKLKKGNSQELSRTADSKSVTQSLGTTRSESQDSGLPVLSTTHQFLNVRGKSGKQSSRAILKTHQDENLKRRLNDTVRAFDVIAIVLGQQIQKYDEQLHEAFAENSRYELHVKALEAKYDELMIAVNTDHTRQIENVRRNHEDELNSLREQYEKQVKIKTKK
ncbi:unnamed protein product [Litomosoides sigmodontis]|uniref:Uncharacterized protein n=1 Tax=Litomosoides sigmodontis TaxID=42156 RepID=A0A3P6VGK1_LITSI|nr:unnamed protein product [Litomosoides sigmodontis]